MHKIFQQENSRGFSNLIMQGLPVEDAAKTVMDNLDLITSGPIPPNPSEMLSSAKTRSLWAELSKIYDYVLIDSPPVLAVADASILASQAEGVLMVVRSGSTRNDFARKAKEQLLTANASIIGTVINGMKQDTQDYQYYYYYYANENESEKTGFFSFL